MTRYPHDFPWQVLACLAVTLACFLGAVFSALCAVGRTLRDRRRELERGQVPPATDWSKRPNDFSRDWYRGAR